MADDPPGPLGEFGEHAIFLGREVDFLAAAGHPAIVEVDRHVADRHDRADRLVGQAVAQRGADAGEQFLGVERLGQVIVGAEIERGDLLRGVLARGDDDQRRADAP